LTIFPLNNEVASIIATYLANYISLAYEQNVNI